MDPENKAADIPEENVKEESANNNNREAYIAKKEEREKKRLQQKQVDKQSRMKGYIVPLVLTILILGGIGYGFFGAVKKQLPQGEDLSQPYPELGRDHIEVGADHDPYNSNPPTSGWHYAQPAQAGFYNVDEVIPDEQVVHNLEHGDIWIAYRPSISDAHRDILRSFAAPKVIITAREANDTDIAVVGWTRLDTFNIDGDALPEQRIRDFIARFTNQGPERVPTPTTPHRR